VALKFSAKTRSLSGSTLFQNILAQNPAFYLTPTSGLLELVFGARLPNTHSAEFKSQDAAAMKTAFWPSVAPAWKPIFRR
jgi:hypothetical protein